MSKTSKILQVQNDGMVGQWYKFEYHLEDGYTGSAYGKNSKPFGSPGDVIEYDTDVDKQGLPKIRIVKKISGPSVNTEAQRVDAQKANVEVNKGRLDFDKDKQILIIRQSSIKSAVEYCANKDKVDYMDVLGIADIFTNYVLTGNHPDPVENDKLPF